MINDESHNQSSLVISRLFVKVLDSLCDRRKNFELQQNCRKLLGTILKASFQKFGGLENLMSRLRTFIRRFKHSCNATKEIESTGT